MSSEEDKLRHSSRRKRNMVKKNMSDFDRRGAYAIKIVDARKPEYQRVNMRVQDVVESEQDDEVSV